MLKGLFTTLQMPPMVGAGNGSTAKKQRKIVPFRGPAPHYYG
jgi:hypothetical protein